MRPKNGEGTHLASECVRFENSFSCPIGQSLAKKSVVHIFKRWSMLNNLLCFDNQPLFTDNLLIQTIIIGKV